MLRRDEDAPKPEARRRKGETGREFRRLTRKLLPAAFKTGAAARGCYAALQPAKADVSAKASACVSAKAGTTADRLATVDAFASADADVYADTGMYLADTIGWLNLWQDNANNEQWHDDNFSAKQDYCFPQP